MKKIHIIVGIAIILLIIAIFQRRSVGLLLGKYNLIVNNFNVTVDKNINTDSLYIYWNGKTEYVDENENNKLLIYHRKVQMSIPDSYGDNVLIIKYGNKTFSKIGFLNQIHFPSIIIALISN